jgi:hypothetical protein
MSFCQQSLEILEKNQKDTLPDIFFKLYFWKFTLFQTKFCLFPTPEWIVFCLMQSRKFLSAVDYDLDKVKKVKYHDIKAVRSDSLIFLKWINVYIFKTNCKSYTLSLNYSNNLNPTKN